MKLGPAAKQRKRDAAIARRWAAWYQEAFTFIGPRLTPEESKRAHEALKAIGIEYGRITGNVARHTCEMIAINIEKGVRSPPGRGK